MKTLLITVILAFTLNGQVKWLAGGVFDDVTGVFAVDLDGSAQYMSKTSPVGFDLNGANRIVTIANNSTFEDATDWGDNGTHAIDTVQTSPIVGSASGRIISSGAGDAATNYVSLIATPYYTKPIAGLKYSAEFKTDAVFFEANDSLYINVGTQSFGFVLSETATLQTFNFEAIAGDTVLKMYLNTADTVLIDSWVLSEAYDLTVMAWVKFTVSTNRSLLVTNNGSGIRVYGDAAGKLVFFPDASVNTAFFRYNNTALNDGAWHLISWVNDRADFIDAYLDGVIDNGAQVGDGTFVGKGTAKTSLYVGKLYSNWQGLIGEIQVIRGLLTASEILTAYNRGRSGKHFLETGNEIGWWKMEDATDETGNNDLTIEGSPTFIELKNYK